MHAPPSFTLPHPAKSLFSLIHEPGPHSALLFFCRISSLIYLPKSTLSLYIQNLSSHTLPLLAPYFIHKKCISCSTTHYDATPPHVPPTRPGRHAASTQNTINYLCKSHRRFPPTSPRKQRVRRDNELSYGERLASRYLPHTHNAGE